ncbi:hypothetical protein MRB53_038500 [Persea americana]|nr:hypothetical protein MRB53_038500 [Persea americana]
MPPLMGLVIASVAMGRVSRKGNNAASQASDVGKKMEAMLAEPSWSSTVLAISVSVCTVSDPGDAAWRSFKIKDGRGFWPAFPLESAPRKLSLTEAARRAMLSS